MGKKNAPKPPMENDQELANLKSLNKILVRQTMELRGQVESFQESKNLLELEIERLKSDRSIEADISKNVVGDFVKEELEQEKEKMWREKDELRVLLDEKNREVEEVRDEFGRFREEVGFKESEVERLRSAVDDVKEEVRKIRLERDAALGLKSELESKIEDLKREMADVVQEKGEIDKEKVGKDGEIDKLEKELEGVNAEIFRVRGNLEGVVSQRDEIGKRLDGQVEEMERLKVQLVELEKCNSATEEELGKLRSDRRKLVDERKDTDRKLEAVVKDKGLIEEKLAESFKLAEELKSSLVDLGREKEEIEQDRAKQVVEITGLQQEVEVLQASEVRLLKTEELLVGKYSVMENYNGKLIKKQEKMQLEIDALVQEKSEIRRMFELLMEEKNSALRNLEENVAQLDAEKRKIDEILNEKAEIEKAKNDQEVELVQLRKQVSDLKASVSTLEESCQTQVVSNARIQSEAKQYKDDLDSVTHERENLWKEVNLKIKEEERLKTEVLGLEKKVVETQQELEWISSEHNSLLAEKDEMKSCINTLTKEKEVLQEKLLNVEEDIAGLQAKMESYEMYTEQALLMLKNTVEIVCNPGDVEMDGNEDLTIISAEEIKPFAAEIEAIRRAFKSKKGNAEDMNREFESLKLTVAEAHKKRNFWAWLSSAATIVAAVSMAYVARVRQ